MTEIEIKLALTKAILDLAKAGNLEAGSQIVIGCSTSEIAGGRIGKNSVPELGTLVAGTVINVCREKGFIPVFQCCEHLNRALVLPLEAAKQFGYTRVHAIPQPHAGGSTGAAAWKLMEHPCLVAAVQVDAGLDIGDTLIGMHLRPVAVPYRGEVKSIGEARLVCAYTRLPYIGGERAVYKED